jgi:hypothetical protein
MPDGPGGVPEQPVRLTSAVKATAALAAASRCRRRGRMGSPAEWYRCCHKTPVHGAPLTIPRCSTRRSWRAARNLPIHYPAALGRRSDRRTALAEQQAEALAAVTRRPRRIGTRGRLNNAVMTTTDGSVEQCRTSGKGGGAATRAATLGLSTCPQPVPPGRTSGPPGTAPCPRYGKRKPGPSSSRPPATDAGNRPFPAAPRYTRVNLPESALDGQSGNDRSGKAVTPRSDGTAPSKPRHWPATNLSQARLPASMARQICRLWTSAISGNS